MKKKLIAITIMLLWSSGLLAKPITAPESFFGFQLGSDYKLASWSKIVDYFWLLNDESDCIQVTELGKSTESNPFIMAIISSRENMKNLDTYRSISRRVARGRGSSPNRLQDLAEKGKTVVMITCSIHATECGATQASPELAYKLITEKTPRINRILEDVIFLLVPSFNPDGLIMVKDWYDKFLETPYQDSHMPWLYHTYTGHDNNRDAFMLTQVESKLVTKVLYKEWYPQIYMDMHQMGNRSARMFLPPYDDPVNPHLDPLIVKQNSLIGEYMTTNLQAKGFKGVISGTRFTHWWQGGFLRTAWFHNMVGILSEAASARLATPIFQEKSDIRIGGPTANNKGATVNYPDPWTGGWWRLRDIVEYDLEIMLSLLNFGALHKAEYFQNVYALAQRAIQKGKNEPPFAYVIPPEQWDRLAAYHLMDVLHQGGVRIHQAVAEFEADERMYPKGSFVVLMAQPYRAYAEDLLSPLFYPDIREYRDGPPDPPYDAAAWTLPYQMGVDVKEIKKPFEAQLVRLRSIEFPKNKLNNQSGYGYLVDGRQTDSFIAVNLALKTGLDVYRTAKSLEINDQTYPPGGFVFQGSGTQYNDKIQTITEKSHLQFIPLSQKPQGLTSLKPVQLAVYQPWLSSMHEGWSRWVLEQYNFEYTTIHNKEVRAGGLKNDFDIIYMPDIYVEGILEGRPEGYLPPKFVGGIEAEGLYHLYEFVDSGGVLITMDASSELIMGHFGLPVENILEDVKRSEFFCPGSILKIQVNPKHPLGYGMKSTDMAFFRRNRVFKILHDFDTPPEVIAKYPPKKILKSGYVLGEEYITDRPAVVDVPVGKGHVVLIGFDAINRAQAQNTFKIFFNAIYYGGLQ